VQRIRFHHSSILSRAPKLETGSDSPNLFHSIQPSTNESRVGISRIGSGHRSLEAQPVHRWPGFDLEISVPRLIRYSVSSLSFKDHRKFVVAAANAAANAAPRKRRGRSFRRAIYHDVPFSDVSSAIRSVLITVHDDGTHACKSIRAHYLSARHRRTRGTRGNAAFIGGLLPAHVNQLISRAGRKLITLSVITRHCCKMRSERATRLEQRDKNRP